MNRGSLEPDYWTGEVPEPILNRTADAQYEGTRIPGEYLV